MKIANLVNESKKYGVIRLNSKERDDPVVYFYRFEAKGFTDKKRMILVK